MRTMVAAGLALVCVLAGAPAGAASLYAPIQGGGSGFAALEIDQWRADTARPPLNLTVNYVAQGSTFGREQFGAGVFDFGASDIPYMESELGPGGLIGNAGQRCAGSQLTECFVYVPVSAGGLAFMYNLTDDSGTQVNNLRLTRDEACKIFTGAITKWNDPEIVATNPQLASFNRNIRPVIRSDGAGESYVLSQFCIAEALQVWSAFVAAQRANSNTWDGDSAEFKQGLPTSVWPQQGWGSDPVSVPFADGTANYVADPVGGPNAITYVAAGYARVRSFPVASLQNAGGLFTQPDAANVTAGLAHDTANRDGTVRPNFTAADPAAYQPATYSYVIAPTRALDPRKGDTLRAFLCYAVTTGQQVAPELAYAPLSAAVRSIAIDRIGRIPDYGAAKDCAAVGQPGYWLADAAGGVYSFGGAQPSGAAHTRFATHIAAMPNGRGYWIVNAAGQVYAFGAAHYYGAASNLAPGEMVTSLSPSASGAGYWLFTNRGRVRTFGDAKFHGDLAATHLNGSIVASIATSTGGGYYMVGSDGGIFAFGDAHFYGSMGATRLHRPVIGLAPTPSGRGYWLVASDGGVFAFGDARFRGSMGGTSLREPVTGLIAFGDGYLMVAADGGVFDFSNRAFLGSLAGHPPAAPVVGIAGVATTS